jgi:hypothetical protein
MRDFASPRDNLETLPDDEVMLPSVATNDSAKGVLCLVANFSLAGVDLVLFVGSAEAAVPQRDALLRRPSLLSGKKRSDSVLEHCQLLASASAYVSN